MKSAPAGTRPTLAEAKQRAEAMNAARGGQAFDGRAARAPP
jgi:hypothetical protein